MKKYGILQLGAFFVLAALAGCEPTPKMVEPTPGSAALGASHFSEPDYENVDHLVLLNQKAGPQEIRFSEESIQIAKRMISAEGHLFPRVQLEEALKTYPTPEILLYFADGFLKVAQFHLLNRDATLKTPLGNNDVIWYFEGAYFYYGLAMEFSKKINQPFSQELGNQIALTRQCIRQIVLSEKFVKSSPCEYPHR